MNSLNDEFDDFSDHDDENPEWNSDMLMLPKEDVERMTDFISKLGGSKKILTQMRETNVEMAQVFLDEIKKKELTIAQLQFAFEHVLRLLILSKRQGSQINIKKKEIVKMIDNDMHLGDFRVGGEFIFIPSALSDSSDLTYKQHTGKDIKWDIDNSAEDEIVTTEIVKFLLNITTQVISQNDEDRSTFKDRMIAKLDKIAKGEKNGN
tara:strand:+ start:731 stop:1351 length:621 start_codon:yes stop_codon:yes gene_type:complete